MKDPDLLIEKRAMENALPDNPGRMFKLKVVGEGGIPQLNQLRGKVVSAVVRKNSRGNIVYDISGIAKMVSGKKLQKALDKGAVRIVR